MAVRLSPTARQQFLDTAGNPYVGAKLFTYLAGTSTKQATYTTSIGDVENTNPLVLDAAGRTPSGLWLTEGADYKFVLAPAFDTDPPESAIYTEDNINGVNDMAALAAATGSDLVGYIAEGAGAVATTVQARLRRESVSLADYTTTAQALASGKIVVFDADATITIPTDAPTLQAAIDAIDAKPNVTVTINIATGHALTAGFRIENRDCSFIKLTSTDATVVVDPAFTFVSNTDLSSDVPRSTLIAFLAVRAKMPTWDILVDMTGVSCVSGYELDYTSDGVVLPGKGVKNTADADTVNGCNCRVTTGSRLSAAQTVWTGAKAGNVGVTLNSTANFQTADLSSTANEACLDVSRGSVVHAKDANCSNGKYAGIYARRSFVFAEAVNVSNCDVGVWSSHGSYIAATTAVFDGCTTDVNIAGGSWIGLGRAQKSGANLVPTNSVVSHPTSGSETLKAFNVMGGYGCIAYENNLPGHAMALSASTPAVLTTGATQQNIASATYQTALTLDGKKTVYGGTIYGPDTGIRITIDGAVVLSDLGRFIGDDNVGDVYAVVPIPPCKCESSILIECYNRAGVAADFAWRFYHN